MKTRNSETLTDFIAYCLLHPDERFWQALRNWAEVDFILFSDTAPIFLDAVDIQSGYDASLEDTFYREGK